MCSTAVLMQVGLLAPVSISAQNAPTPPVLSAFEQQVLQAFDPGGKSVSTLTLTGNVTWTAGSLEESGSVVLKASSDGSTAETWTLPSQSHAYTTAALAAGRSCVYTDNKGMSQTISDPNCMRSLAWFAPWIGLSFIPQGTVLGTDVTQPADTANGQEKLSFQTGFIAPGASGSAAAQELAQLESRAAMTVTFDQKTALPAALDFDQILDSDPAHTIKYRVVLSEYRAESGIMLPHHIQRYIQRTLQSDITITSVNVE